MPRSAMCRKPAAPSASQADLAAMHEAHVAGLSLSDAFADSAPASVADSSSITTSTSGTPRHCVHAALLAQCSNAARAAAVDGAKPGAKAAFSAPPATDLDHAEHMLPSSPCADSCQQQNGGGDCTVHNEASVHKHQPPRSGVAAQPLLPPPLTVRYKSATPIGATSCGEQSQKLAAQALPDLRSGHSGGTSACTLSLRASACATESGNSDGTTGTAYASRASTPTQAEQHRSKRDSMQSPASKAQCASRHGQGSRRLRNHVRRADSRCAQGRAGAPPSAPDSVDSISLAVSGVSSCNEKPPSMYALPAELVSGLSSTALPGGVAGQDTNAQSCRAHAGATPAPYCLSDTAPKHAHKESAASVSAAGGSAPALAVPAHLTQTAEHLQAGLREASSSVSAVLAQRSNRIVATGVTELALLPCELTSCCQLGTEGAVPALHAASFRHVHRAIAAPLACCSNHACPSHEADFCAPS